MIRKWGGQCSCKYKSTPHIVKFCSLIQKRKASRSWTPLKGSMRISACETSSAWRKHHNTWLSVMTERCEEIFIDHQNIMMTVFCIRSPGPVISTGSLCNHAEQTFDLMTPIRSLPMLFRSPAMFNWQQILWDEGILWHPVCVTHMD